MSALIKQNTESFELFVYLPAMRARIDWRVLVESFCCESETCLANLPNRWRSPPSDCWWTWTVDDCPAWNRVKHKILKKIDFELSLITNLDNRLQKKIFFSLFVTGIIYLHVLIIRVEYVSFLSKMNHLYRKCIICIENVSFVSKVYHLYRKMYQTCSVSSSSLLSSSDILRTYWKSPARSSSSGDLPLPESEHFYFQCFGNCLHCTVMFTYLNYIIAFNS